MENLIYGIHEDVKFENVDISSVTIMKNMFNYLPDSYQYFQK